MQSWDLPSNLRRAAFAFFGVYGTELNPEFLELATGVLPKSESVWISAAFCPLLISALSSFVIFCRTVLVPRPYLFCRTVSPYVLALFLHFLQLAASWRHLSVAVDLLPCDTAPCS